MTAFDIIYLCFNFALGSCVGSFLNVVVWRLPRVKPVEGESLFKSAFRSLEALSDPPSHCPKCNHLLKWYDNIPIVGWIKLAGKCRFCKTPISARYPIVETITALIFAGYFVAFFVFQIGPCLGIEPNGNVIWGHLNFRNDYWVYYLDMALLSALLAASLIDAELFIIPLGIPWTIAAAGIVVHTICDSPGAVGSVITTPVYSALAIGGFIGLVLSIILLEIGFLKPSFADGAPMTEKERDDFQKAKSGTKADKSDSKKAGKDSKPEEEDEPREWSAGEVRREILLEFLFLLPPIVLGIGFAWLVHRFPAVAHLWSHVTSQRWASALLGSILGALVGGFTVWITRVLGSLAFGREAMGMGDVDLMMGVGAVLGAGPAVVVFFVAPFLGILFAVYGLIARRKRELPYGPYLSLAAAVVILLYGPIASYFAPGLAMAKWMLNQWLGNA